MNPYIAGTVVLGAYSPGTRAVLIRFKDIESLVAVKGGATGAAAYAIAPNTVEAKAYADLAAKLKEGLEKEGAPADVTVVNPASYRPAAGSSGWKWLAIGLVGIGAVVGLLYWTRR